ncbi:MAG: hypothetical protein LBH43_01485 [Treponema sp.]|jgi:hypothetical protein|nr:hypothetical protein [Treponema sp.]
MKNKAIDLHNIMFEQLERLNDLDDEEMKSDKLLRELKRNDGVCKISAQIISNGRLVHDSMVFKAKHPKGIDLPEMLIAKQIEAPKSN